MIPDTCRLSKSRRAASSLSPSSSALHIKTVYPLALASSSIAFTRAAQKKFRISEIMMPMVLVCWVRNERLVPLGA